MTPKIHTFLIIAIFVLFGNIAKASHFLGGEISYACLGNNQYEITLTSYYDCGGINAPNSFVLDYTSSCNTFSNSAQQVGVEQEIVSTCPTVATTCTDNTSAFYGTIKVIYKDTVTLAACADWKISYSSCCRNALVINPTNQAFYVESSLNNLNGNCNNSPVFQNDPLLSFCINDTTTVSYSAFDADGDSLVYHLVPALVASGQNATYTAGYSGTNPFSGSVSFNAQTGLMTIVPTITEYAGVCVKVEEYRNGIKIGDITREVQMYTLNCTNNLPKVQTANSPNIYSGGMYVTTAGLPLSLSLQIQDAEVQAGTQTLTPPVTNISTIPGATSNFDSTTSTLTITWTPTISDIGKHSFSMAFNDDNCPLLGKNQYSATFLVLNPPTIIANDDYFIGQLDATLNGNLIVNDVSSGMKVINTTPILTPLNGFVTINTNGNFTYTPHAGFIGIDSFSYEVCNGNFCDIAVAFMNIVPTIIITDTVVLGATYPNYYCLSDSAYFISDTLQNAVLTFVNDSCFALYGDNLGTDTTVLQSFNERVIFQITVQNGVWPGDTDDDALVNNTDLLNIGTAYNTVGVPRNPQSIIWNGYLANDWNTTFTNGLDYKYADTDGNGTVNADDTLAIIQNWGLTYNKNGGGTGAPIYLAVDSITITNDSLASIPIMLGTSQLPVANIHGLAFTISYNWELVKDSTIKAFFNPTWFGTNNQNMISIQKNFYSDELIEVAITRIDGNNIGGFGQLGKLDFTIQDDIIRGGDSIFHFNVLNIQAITNDETVVDLQGLNRQTHWQDILDIANNTSKIDLSNHINIYPNPALDYLNIETKGVQIETIKIYDLTGRNVAQNQNWNNTNRLNISELSQGMYIVHVKTNLGVWNEKVMILK